VAAGLADLESAGRAPDVAGSRDAARAARERCGDPLAPARTAAESLLAWDGDPAAARRTLEAALALHPGAATDGSFLFLLGSAHLRTGDARAASELFAAAARADPHDEVRLQVRPMIRRLQALQWAGEVEAARDLARDIAPALGEWGTNRQLAWLVGGLLRPVDDPVRLLPDVPAPAGDLLRLKDTGFTCVAVRVRGAPHLRRVPMSLRQGYWEARVPLAGADVLYGFEVEGGEIVVDPEAREVVEREGILWSRPPPAPREPGPDPDAHSCVGGRVRLCLPFRAVPL